MTKGGPWQSNYLLDCLTARCSILMWFDKFGVCTLRKSWCGRYANVAVSCEERLEAILAHVDVFYVSCEERLEAIVAHTDFLVPRLENNSTGISMK